MSLFQCDGCGCLENTALTECGHGQMRSEIFVTTDEAARYREHLGLDEPEALGDYCSACCPL